MSPRAAKSAPFGPSVTRVQLLLVQHGQAKTEHEDPDRPLTRSGAADVERVARWAIEGLGMRPGRILHSGRTRAKQTAEIWGTLRPVDIEGSDGLAPNDDPAMWAGRLDAIEDSLLLVGHLPHLDRLAGTLLAGDATRSPVQFRPGGLVGLVRTDGTWRVTMVLPPDGG